MASWILVPCLEELREEFNELGPNRDKASDGSIGDAAHQGSNSDHNPDETGATHDEDDDNRDEVHAIDVDCSGPWVAGFTFDPAVDYIRQRCKDGRENRLQNIIWNRRIASEDNGWVWKNYTGSNAHTQHAHFSARYDTGKLEDDRRPWGLVERWGDMALSSDDLNKIRQIVSEEVEKRVGDVVQRYDGNGQPITGSGNDTMGVDAALGYLAKDVINLDNKVDDLLTRVPAPAAAAKSTRATAK